MAAASRKRPLSENEETPKLGDSSPQFRKLSEDDKLNVLLGSVPPTLAALPDHALDGAKENSKIVVVARPEDAGRMAVLATPDGPQTLPEGDPAHRLPLGSKIYKTPEGYFEARLPDEYIEHVPAPGTFARAAELLAHINSRIAGDVSA